MMYVEPIGTGGSGKLATHPEGYQIARYVEALHRLILHIDGEPPLLLGHSHGGFVALFYVLAHPGNVAGLVLYDSAPAAGADVFVAATHAVQAFAARMPDQPEAAAALQAWQSAGAIHDDAGYTAALHALFPVYFADYWARVDDFAPLRAGVKGTHVSSGGYGFDVRSELGAIQCPTLIIAGRHDFICGPRWAEELHSGIPRSDLAIFEASGHFAHLEEADAFAQRVIAFGEQPRAAPGELG